MAQARCWSSIVAGPDDRTALRLDRSSSWPIACELAEGHPGPHAGDGGHGFGRRPWLVWGDFALAPYACREQDPCPASSLDHAPCRLFGGHSGDHRFPAAARVTPPVRPVVSTPPPMAPVPARHLVPEAPETMERVSVGGAASDERRAEGPAVGKKTKKKHHPHDPGDPDDVQVTAGAAAADSALGPMIEVRGYSDMTRTSLVEVVQPDGSTRIVLMPVSGDDVAAERRTVTSVQVPMSELEHRRVEAVSATVTEVVDTAARVLAADSGAVTGEGDTPALVRHQVGEALREVAVSLAKLADSLDPR